MFEYTVLAFQLKSWGLLSGLDYKGINARRLRAAIDDAGLKHLVLGSSAYDDQIMRALGYTVFGSNVTSLDLSDCEFSHPDALQQIFRVLRNTKITCLLVNNAVGVDHSRLAPFILDGLRNSRVCELGLDWVNYSPKFISDVQAILVRNRVLNNLSVARARHARSAQLRVAIADRNEFQPIGHYLPSSLREELMLPDTSARKCFSAPPSLSLSKNR